MQIWYIRWPRGRGFGQHKCEGLLGGSGGGSRSQERFGGEERGRHGGRQRVDRDTRRLQRLLWRLLRADEDVVRFDVHVDQVAAMDVLKARGDVIQDEPYDALVQVLFVDSLLDEFASALVRT
jgi:hypothetical protein